MYKQLLILADEGNKEAIRCLVFDSLARKPMPLHIIYQYLPKLDQHEQKKVKEQLYDNIAQEQLNIELYEEIDF